MAARRTRQTKKYLRERTQHCSRNETQWIRLGQPARTVSPRDNKIVKMQKSGSNGYFRGAIVLNRKCKIMKIREKNDTFRAITTIPVFQFS